MLMFYQLVHAKYNQMVYQDQLDQLSKGQPLQQTAMPLQMPPMGPGLAPNQNLHQMQMLNPMQMNPMAQMQFQPMYRQE